MVLPTPLRGHMGDLINLRTERKRARRRDASEQAAESRLQHGVPKAERVLQNTRETKIRHDLDQHRIDKGEGQ